MTEQQEHLSNLLQQRESLRAELEKLQTTSASRRETYFKVQGAIEYLAQIGVELPEPPAEKESAEEPAGEVASGETKVEEGA